VSAIAVWEFYQMKGLKAQLDTAKAETGDTKTNAFTLRKDLDASKAQLLLALQEDVSQSQTRVLQELGTQRELPKNETPSIALVTDISKLSGEAFFADGENGDYIIAYKKANISILYRPLDKKIINTGTVKVDG
jgi:hypothetical protein